MPESRGENPIVQPVSQVELTIPSRPDVDVFDEVRHLALRWIEARAGSALPEEAWRGETFQLAEVGAQRTEAVMLADPRYWVARLDDADRTVPRRTWATEISLGQDNEGAVVFACRLQCVTRGERRPFEPSVPRLVREIVTEFPCLLDAHPAHAEPFLVDDEAGVDRLLLLLQNPRRRRDVIVFALPEGSRDPTDVVANAERVARRTTGAAHVAILTGPASYHLSDRVGREFSVFHQGVRTYRPGFEPEKDELLQHPLGLPEQIRRWRDSGPSAYEHKLVLEALRQSVSDRNINERVPPFIEVRRHIRGTRRQEAREAGSSDTDLLKLAYEEIEQLNTDIQNIRTEYQSLLDEAERERDIAFSEAEAARATNIYLRKRVDNLYEEIKRHGGQQTPRIPETLEGFQEWCERHLAGSVELHVRALKGIKKSRFENVELIYRALLLLRDVYVPMRRGATVSIEDFERACAEIGVEEAPTFTGPEWGHQGEEYIVRYQGQKQRLERHLKRGNSRDERYCFRLYFFWDSREEKVVVGWLPSHLTTRDT